MKESHRPSINAFVPGTAIGVAGLAAVTLAVAAKLNETGNPSPPPVTVPETLPADATLNIKVTANTAGGTVMERVHFECAPDGTPVVDLRGMKKSAKTGKTERYTDAYGLGKLPICYGAKLIVGSDAVTQIAVTDHVKLEARELDRK